MPVSQGRLFSAGNKVDVNLYVEKTVNDNGDTMEDAKTTIGSEYVKLEISEE